MTNSAANDEMRVGIVDPVSGIDPHVVREFAGTMIARHVFEPLCELGANGKVVPRLLEATPRLAEGTTATYEAQIRDGIRFSDGTLLRAEHVVESLRRCGRLGPQARISGHGLTLAIELPQKSAGLGRELSSGYASIVLARGDELLGTGPYVWVRDSDRVVHLEHNPHWRGDRPSVGTVKVIAYPSGEGTGTSRLIQALGDGEVDFTSSLSRDDVDRLTHVRKRFAPATSTAVLWLNAERLADLRLRKAIVTAVDRNALGGAAGTVSSFVARGVLPPPFGRFNDAHRFRPDDARMLLREAGIPGRPLRMCVVWGPRRYLPDPEDTARRIAAQLQAVGIDVDIEPASNSDEYMRRWAAGDYDLLLGGWNADSDDPVEFVRAFYASGSIHGPGRTSHGCNLSRWSDPRTDEMLAGIAAEGTARLDPLLRYTDEKALLIALYHGAVVLAYGSRVRTIETDDFGFPRFADMQLRLT